MTTAIYYNIGAEGATALGVALHHNTTLTTLNLSSNNIGAEGATALWGSATPQYYIDYTLPIGEQHWICEGYCIEGSSAAQSRYFFKNVLDTIFTSALSFVMPQHCSDHSVK